jgi:sarcosine oxidase subunit gamma
VDQSDARAVIEISGSKAREALAKGISIDLHPQAFGVGDSASTLAVQLWITLWQTELAPTYRIAVFRAFGSSVLEWLVNSSAEFGCQIIDEPIF